MKTRQKTTKSVFLIALVIATISLGFYRDFVFKSINALLKAKDFEATFTLPSSLSFFQNMEYNTLGTTKWILTLICALLFLIISVFFIKILFVNKNYIKYTIWSYILITTLSFLIIALGFLFKKHFQDFYSVSRYLMGIVQSPILLMILIPAFKIAEVQQKEIEKRNS